MSTDDTRFMRLALALGRRNRGSTWPNPSVGAVIVDPAEGRIIAVGSTEKGGRPHAEPVALAAAGEAARGATLYVSLEPCSHHGRTPPCADAVIASGVSRVVTALEDPDPRVRGRGHARLRSAGIAVDVGICAAAAARDHAGHLTRMRKERPWVTLKLARTADGYAATPSGPRLLITGEAANAGTHMLRLRHDAVMVGIGTILADDPLLTVRLPGLETRSPLRIVVDTRLRLPPAAAVATSRPDQPTIVICDEAADRARAGRLAAHGLEVVRMPALADNGIDLRQAMRGFAERGLTRVLCEGGPRLAEALAEADLVDELVLMTNTRRLDRPGSVAIRPGLETYIRSTLAPAGDERLGEDRVQTYRREDGCSPGS